MLYLRVCKKAAMFCLFALMGMVVCLPSRAECLQLDGVSQCNEQGQHSTSQVVNQRPAFPLNTSLEVPPDLARWQGEPQRESVTPSTPVGEQTIWVPRGTPTWGALAKDFQIPGLQGIGISSNWLTPEDAANEATRLCLQSGGTNCYVETVFANRCLGVALGENEWIYWEVDVTKSTVAQRTVVTCSEKSRTLCRLVFAECSYPVP